MNKAETDLTLNLAKAKSTAIRPMAIQLDVQVPGWADRVDWRDLFRATSAEKIRAALGDVSASVPAGYIELETEMRWSAAGDTMSEAKEAACWISATAIAWAAQVNIRLEGLAPARVFEEIDSYRRHL